MYNSVPVKFIKYLFLIFLFSGIFQKANAGLNRESDSAIYNRKNFTAEELIRGERLFYGLVYQDGKSVNCAACHITSKSDKFIWDPDALEISKKYLDKSAKDLSEILLNPFGQKMSVVHKEFKLAPTDIVLIKAYMDKFVSIGLVNNKPVITNLLFFILAAVLLFFSLTDLIITKLIKKTWIHYIILITTTSFISYSLAVDAIALGRSENYSPFQPVKFSHAVHAGQNEINCIYCHSYAHYSKISGTPPENVCMNCHLIVRTGSHSGSFEIAKVTGAYETGRPLKWIKVHNLPDHVFFSHEQHVEAGKVACEECHGNVKEMDVIKQVSDLSMGWCINCHRTKKLDVQSNNYYSEYRDLVEKVKNGSVDSVTVSMLGATECMKCHY